MDLIARFFDRWQQLRPTSGEDALSLTARTATAAADTLPGVSGAAICLHDTTDARLLIGVSDPQSLLAEELEYTVGDGPGLHAQRTSSSITAGHHFARRWPVFHNLLVSRTSFVAARAVPLPTVPAEWSAMLLLYYSGTQAAHDADNTDIIDVAAIAACAVTYSVIELAAQLEVPGGPGLCNPIWRRLPVNTAVGLMITARQASFGDALGVLRAYAYAHDETLASTAQHLISGHLDTHTVWPPT